MRSVLVRVHVALGLLLAGCGAKVEPVQEVVAFRAPELPLDPAAAAWESVPAYTAALRPQDLVDPRLMTASTKEVRVRALIDGSQIALRLDWDDATANDLPGTARFLDGCAIQIPRAIGPEPPDAQMGSEGAPVDLVFWRADWQASVNGREDTINALYPNATVDHYPFQAPSLEPGSAAQQAMGRRFAPAEAVGNRRAGPRERPVEALSAEGPGTLRPNPDLAADGQGVRTKAGWAAVIRRPLPAGLSPQVRGQIAFAVWEGGAEEAGARKMITGWTPLAVREEAAR